MIGAIIATIALIALLIYLFKYQIYHLHPKILKVLAPMPGSPVTHCLYNIYHYWGNTEFVWTKFREINEIYPRLFKMWIANRAAIFLKHPDDIEVLLTSNTNIAKSELYSFIIFWLREGLLVSKGEKWKLRRKLLTPAFHFNILKQFIPVIERCSQQTCLTLESECSKEFSDVVPMMSDHTLDTLCETTMGITIDNKTAEIRDYKSAINNFGAMLLERLLQPWIWNDFVMWKTNFGHRLSAMITILRTFTRNVIKARMDDDLSREYEAASGKKKLPMLDLLIDQMRKGEDIDYAGICEEVDTFMFEGHDTTSMGISFMLMLLACNPDCQKRIYEEQISIFGKSKRLATVEDLQEMVYLERCVKESLRLYPSVPLFARCLSEDMVIKDYVIPATLDVFVMIYDLHRDPEFWPEPNKFDPDRFLPDVSAARHPFAYLPFSAGPRNCIGQKFAMLEMKSIVGKIVREFVLEPVDTPETLIMRIDLVLRPSKNIRIKIRKRS